MQSLNILVEVAIGGLVAWRLGSLLVYEEGPFDIFGRLRAAVGVYDLGADGRPRTFLGRLLDCFWCVSVWLALPISLAIPSDILWLLVWLSISSVAIMIEEYIDRK